MKATKIITHSGKFHADDVFAVASLLVFLGPETSATVIRTRDENIFPTGDYVVDVGGVYDPSRNRFDHHQSGGAGSRENGIPYASFGLVWKHVGETIAGSSALAHIIDTKLASPIDANDNGFSLVETSVPGVYPYSISDAIGAFPNDWKEEREGTRHDDETFMEVVAMAKRILAREIKIAGDKEEAREFVIDAYRRASDKRLIIMDEHYPWKDFLAEFPEPLYVVAPYKDRWGISPVPLDRKKFTNRKDFPSAWAGKRDKELAEVSGVSDAIFCHNNLFFAVAGSKEGALALAQKALNS